MKTIASIVTAVLVSFALARTASAHEHFYFAVLSGSSESPPNASPAGGTAFVTLDLDLITMRVETAIGGLLGTTTSASVHGVTVTPLTGTAGVATPIPGFPTGVHSGTSDLTIDLTTGASYDPAFITASGGTVSDGLNAVINGMAAGKMYLEIQSTAFPGGELRGFLTETVPEPGAAALFAAASFFVLRRSRR